ncbi:hypothetical protein M422DRAFT_23749 [Sphaerobolus stellatus SS14]|nr:hypothetical protein M422DRAFT_23749 [Sphaerobolus stellatus SS14]
MLVRLPTVALALAFTLLPSVDAALFPKKSHVKHIDAKGFKNALKEGRTFVTAFVAPWCGHCQKMVPELSRAAEGLDPLVPVYAVDCDDAKNKPLCAEQGIKGFPTVKLYPKGTQAPPLEFDGTRTSSSFFYWASGAVPGKMERSQTAKGVLDIVRKNPGKPKAVLMNKSNKTPLLWKVISQKYGDKITFVNCRDRKGKESANLGFEITDKKHKLLIFGPNGEEPILYEGIMKYATLSDYFDEVLAGKVDLSHAAFEAQQAVFKAPAAEETAAPKAAEESEEEEDNDEIRIGESGYRGFNPHEGVDLDELIKLGGGFNPHAGAHPGADAPAPKKKKADTKKASSKKAETQSATSTSSAAESSATTKDEL